MTSLALTNAGQSTTPFARLLREGVRELRDPEVRGIQTLRALGIQAKALFVQAHGLVEVERGVLELVRDRLKTLERLVERDLRFSHCARQSPPTRRHAHRACGSARAPPSRAWRLTRGCGRLPPRRSHSRVRAPRVAKALRDGAARTPRAAAGAVPRARSRDRELVARRRCAGAARRVASPARGDRSSAGPSRGAGAAPRSVRDLG